MTSWKVPEFGKFLSVGVLNTLVGLLAIYAAKWLLHAGDVAANVVGYAVGLLVSFALNSRWTFSYRGDKLPAAVKFISVALFAYCMNLLTVLIAIKYVGLNSYIAQAFGIPPYTLTCYFASKYIVFRARPEKHG